MDRRTLFLPLVCTERRPMLHLVPSVVGANAASLSLSQAQSQFQSHFRLTGAADESFWLSDGMGGGVDPQQPQMDRRELLVRVAVAGVGLAVGGAINALSMALARHSLDGRVPEPSADARH